MKRLFALVLVAATLANPFALLAGDDPSIKGELRTSIQGAMKTYIDAHVVDGVYWQYDAVTNQLLKLTFKGLHDGIVKKGDFYVSCADFATPDGKIHDLDFIVAEGKDGVVAVQGIVHKLGDEKRAYSIVEEKKP